MENMLRLRRFFSDGGHAFQAGTLSADLCGQARARVSMPYSVDEERFNSASHLIGGILSLLFGVFAFMAAIPTLTWQKSVSIVVYTLAMLALYSASTAYHSAPQGKLKAILRVMDHCTIYLLIAGCYTPFCLIVLPQRTGQRILLAEWLVAAAGSLLNVIDMDAKPVKCLSQVSYVIMGWLIVFAIQPLMERVSSFCFLCLLTGGIFYTVGIVFYGLGKKVRYMHCLWHIFVLLGSVSQFISILQIMQL